MKSRVLPGKQSCCLFKTLNFDRKTHKNMNGLIIIFFGKRPWYKRDNAQWGVCYQEWMDFAKATIYSW